MKDSRFFPLALHRLPTVGSATYEKLVARFGGAEQVLSQRLSVLDSWLKPDALRMLGELQSHLDQSPLGLQVLQDLEWLDAAPQRYIISIDDDRYPPLLRETPKAPPLLFVRGNPDCLFLPQIAIVGSRNPSADGQENARRFSHYLAANGFAITSGLALGVDGAAHEGALLAKGSTIAVMGTGIDKLYPARHRMLAEKILAEGGALVSEFPLGTGALATNFPQRNRIISGLSCGVLIVEAAVKSGSLITAQLALDQNREVFAIPGSIHNPLARGCHQLIRQGASLVETAQDILDQLAGVLGFQKQLSGLTSGPWTDNTSHPSGISPKPRVSVDELSQDEQLILSAIRTEAITLDDLVGHTGLDVGHLAGQLISLEMKGLVRHECFGYVRA